MHQTQNAFMDQTLCKTEETVIVEVDERSLSNGTMKSVHKINQLAECGKQIIENGSQLDIVSYSPQ